MFNERLRECRIKTGMSQRMFARSVGLSADLYNKYEQGVSRPSPETLVVLADALSVTTDFLLNRDIEPTLPVIKNILGIETQKIPLLGEIAAGNPIYADEDFECYVELGAKIQADFALRVKGDSMINARIMDGDIVFIRKQPTVNNGEIAAVLIGDDATLKRFYREGDIVTLLAENPAYPPKVIQLDEAADVRILGKAIAFQSDVR